MSTTKKTVAQKTVAKKAAPKKAATKKVIEAVTGQEKTGKRKISPLSFMKKFRRAAGKPSERSVNRKKGLASLVLPGRRKKSFKH